MGNDAQDAPKQRRHRDRGHRARASRDTPLSVRGEDAYVGVGWASVRGGEAARDRPSGVRQGSLMSKACAADRHRSRQNCKLALAFMVPLLMSGWAGCSPKPADEDGALMKAGLEALHTR